MGDMTFDQFMEDTRIGLLGRHTDDAIATSLRVGRWVNWSYRYISQPNVHRHEELRSSENQLLVANLVAYPLASVAAGQFYAEEDVWISENTADPTRRIYRLLPVRWREFLETASTTGSLPVFYNIRGSALRVNPFPSSPYAGWTVVVDRWVRPSSLSLGTDQTVLPVDWDPVLVQGAVWHGFRSTGDLARAELAKADLDALINNQLDVERVRSEDQTEGVVHMDLTLYEEGLQ